MKKLILIIIFSYSSFLLASSIQSDRPGESIGAGILGKEYLQLESGIILTDSVGRDITLFNNVIRKGVSENFELSAVVDYTKVNGGETGISSTQIGLRAKLIDSTQAKGLIPEMAFQSRVGLNFVDSSFETSNKGLISILSMAHSLSEGLTLTHNFGMTYSGNTTGAAFNWTSNLTKGLNDNWALYVELYGNRFQSINGTYSQIGFDYLISTDTKLDLSYSRKIFDSTDENIINLGISTRFATN